MRARSRAAGSHWRPSLRLELDPTRQRWRRLRRVMWRGDLGRRKEEQESWHCLFSVRANSSRAPSSWTDSLAPSRIECSLVFQLSVVATHLRLISRIIIAGAIGRRAHHMDHFNFMFSLLLPPPAQRARTHKIVRGHASNSCGAAHARALHQHNRAHLLCVCARTLALSLSLSLTHTHTHTHTHQHTFRVRALREIIIQKIYKRLSNKRPQFN